MSALRRRTRFATPFVLSIAACSGGKTHDPPRPKQFPGTIWYVQKSGANCTASVSNLECPKGMMCNPPPPSEAKCPPMPEGRTWVHVAGKSAGVCAVLPDGCTDTSCLGAETPCPLPFGQKLPPP